MLGYTFCAGMGTMNHPKPVLDKHISKCTELRGKCRVVGFLARVEADRSAEDIARELVVKLQTSGAPGLVVSDAQSLLADVRREVARQARLAGTTPIDAPPAKEPR